MPFARLPKILLLLLVPLMLMFSGTAQAQTTGSIKGVVVDDTGIAVPGVLVSASSPQLIGGTQQQQTDPQGRYLFSKLPPGVYTISAEMPGFGKKSYENIQVLIGKTIQLELVLEVQEAGMEIVVEDERPAIDTEQTQRSTVMTEEFLERVPTGRDYLQAVSQAPGVLGSGNANMGGAAYNENTYLIDGVNVTDPVTGTFAVNFNFDAIEQLEVITGAFDAEYSSNLGGIVNIVTKTGGNVLEFQTNVYYETANWSPKDDARYAADGAELAPTGFDSEFSTYQVNAEISGPLIRDKAWFFMSYSGVRSLIANVGIDIPRDYEGHYVLAKVTTQPNAGHRFTAFLQTSPTTIDNIDQSDRFVKAEAQGRQAQGGWVASAQWDWFVSPQTYVETKATVQKSFIENGPVPCTHDRGLGYSACEENETENTVDWDTPGRLGSFNAYDTVNWPYFQFDDRWRYRAESKATFLQKQVPVLPGTHDFKVGVEADLLRWDRVVGYNGDLYFVDLNAIPYDPTTYQNYYWVEITGPFNQVQSGEHYGVFAQDVYKPIDNLTFRYGIRYDRSIMRSNLNEAVVNIGVWGPRFYVAWDPFGDEKTKITGGYGRFNGIGNLGIASDFSSTGFGSKLYLGEYFGDFTNTSTDNYSLSPLENTNTIHDNLTAPHSDEFTLGGERQIISDMVVSAGFTGKFTRNVYVFDETNVIWDEDGTNYVGVSTGEIESLFRLRTPTVSRRDYYQTDIAMRKNFSDRWLAQGTYSYVVSRGTVLTAGNSGLAVPPQAEFAYGNLSTDVRHQVKMQAAYDLPNDPWTTTIGGAFRYYSGSPVNRYYFSSGYGSNAVLRQDLGTYARTEPTYYLDLQIKQAINVPKGQFDVIAIVENVVNARQATSYNSAYINAQNRWVIASRQRPVSFNLGLAYSF